MYLTPYGFSTKGELLPQNNLDHYLFIYLLIYFELLFNLH